VLKSANDITFLRQIKEIIKHYNIIIWKKLHTVNPMVYKPTLKTAKMKCYKL